jgi:guanine nucleotide-binding protein G(I)/G(S)/G(T) subunit beta-1
MNMVASGGLDNTVTVFHSPTSTKESNGRSLEVKGAITTPITRLRAHQGYVSSLKFMDNDHILSASGDGTVMVWHVGTSAVKYVLRASMADVMCARHCPTNTNIIATGGCDSMAYLYDTRYVFDMYTLNTSVLTAS